jgi:hypothetical protein
VVKEEQWNEWRTADGFGIGWKGKSVNYFMEVMGGYEQWMDGKQWKTGWDGFNGSSTG